MRRRRRRRCGSRGVRGGEWYVSSNPVVVSVKRELMIGRDL